MFSTPILSNGGTSRGLPISCFLNYVPDSRTGLSDHYDENIWLASSGGGIGGYWGDIRSNGISTTHGSKSTGSIPFMHVVDSQMLAFNQGTTRRGSYAAYMDISHPEIEEFINMRKESGGDINRKNLNLHNGINITNEFLKAVEEDADFRLIDPKTNEPTKIVNARDLWWQIINARAETGEPYMINIDTCNEALPKEQKDLGLEIKQSNLCSEITLATNEERTAVCCLSSVNLEYFDDWKDEVNFLARLANEYGTDTDYNNIWEYELPVAGIQNDKFGYIVDEDISNPFSPIPIPADGGVNMILTDEDKVNTTLYPRPFTAVKFNQGFNCLGRNNVEIEYAGGLVVPAGINTRYSLFNQCEWVNATASIGSLNARWSSGSSFVQPVVNTAPDTDTPDTVSNFYNTQYTLDAVVSDYNWNGTSAQSLVLPDFDEAEFVATLSTTGIKKFVGDDTPFENGGGHAGVGGSAVVGAGKSGGYAIYGFGNTSQTGANTHFDEIFVGSADDIGFCGIAEQFVGVQSIPFIQSYQQSATDDFQTMMNNFLRVVDVNASTNPDLPEGGSSRYVLGLKIFEGGDGAGGGTIFNISPSNPNTYLKRWVRENLGL